MKTFRRFVLAAFAAFTPLHASAEEIVLKSISIWPSSFASVKGYMKFVDRVKKDGAGIVRIVHVGGPEAIPAEQQGTAIRNGVFDIQFGAASYYSGVIPEADVLRASDLSPVEARKAGATSLLSGIWREKLGADILAWMSGDVGFYLYLTDSPKLNADGQVELHGLKLRSSPAYKEWFEAMGATNVMMAPSDTFSAFDRGMIDGLGGPGINFRDLGIARFIKARVGPSVWQLEQVILMNSKKFDSLPAAARKILVDAAIVHEATTIEDYRALKAEEEAEMKQAGMQFFELQGEAGTRYKHLARDVVWNRLQRVAPAHAEELRRLLTR